MRCEWSLNDALNQRYHDEEWGKPIHEETQHFECLSLELMQSGLSWLTVLRKREAFRDVFHGFEPQNVQGMDGSDVKRLLFDGRIIRHRNKLEAIIQNAKAFVAIQKEWGSFDAYIWGFVGNKPIINHPRTQDEVPSKSPLSEQISKDLKLKGFRYLGPTTVYSYLQASGIVNDHLTTCAFK